MRLLILLLLISSCSFSIDREKPTKKIIIEKLEPIEDTKVKCSTNNLTKLELTKCEMEARLLELKY
jgi:hypothetical protein